MTGGQTGAEADSVMQGMIYEEAATTTNLPAQVTGQEPLPAVHSDQNPINDGPGDIGYFLFSLDTEMGWGSFDRDSYRSRHFSPDGSRERESIIRILDLMDEFGIVGTWAIVGHLLYEGCEECEVCPILDWKGKYHTFEEVYGTRDPLWYGPDILQMILSRNAGHEVAFHGYSHKYFDQLSEADAWVEIQEWLRLARRWNIVPRTVIFPQGRIQHLKLFREAGFFCYRGKEVRHPVLSAPVVGKMLNKVNLALPFLTPQSFQVSIDPSGLVNLPSSYWLFRTNRSVESILDRLGAPKLRLRPAARAIRRGASRSEVFHLWAHPHEFRTERDFDKLRYLLGHVADEVEGGRLVSVTMADLARQVIRRWPI
jgi:hypothetical protein